MGETESNAFVVIDPATWPRASAFRFFSEFEDPFFNMTAVVDVTAADDLCRNEGLSFALSCLFCSQKAVNGIDEFRTRLRDGRIVRYERIDATQTILLEDENFGFCYFPWRGNIREFNDSGRKAVEKYKRLATFDVESGRIDLVYYSVIPWVSFTSFKHATRRDRTQTVPRIVFGRKFEDGGAVKMPVSVEANHAIMDGIHVGRYFEKLQRNLDDCA